MYFFLYQINKNHQYGSLWPPNSIHSKYLIFNCVKYGSKFSDVVNIRQFLQRLRFNSSSILGLSTPTLCFNALQRFSIGLWSGEYDGRPKTLDDEMEEEIKREIEETPGPCSTRKLKARHQLGWMNAIYVDEVMLRLNPNDSAKE